MDEVMKALAEIDKRIYAEDNYEELEAIRQNLVLRVMTIESKQCLVWKAA